MNFEQVEEEILTILRRNNYISDEFLIFLVYRVSPSLVFWTENLKVWVSYVSMLFWTLVQFYVAVCMEAGWKTTVAAAAFIIIFKEYSVLVCSLLQLGRFPQLNNDKKGKTFVIMVVTQSLSLSLSFQCHPFIFHTSHALDFHFPSMLLLWQVACNFVLFGSHGKSFILTLPIITARRSCLRPASQL